MEQNAGTSYLYVEQVISGQFFYGLTINENPATLRLNYNFTDESSSFTILE